MPRWSAILLIFLWPAFSGAQILEGPEFPANDITLNHQSSPSVAFDGAGEFIVTWSGYGLGDADRGIFARRFDAAGDPLGSDFRVNDHTTGAQSYPVVMMQADGEFVVVWQSAGQDGNDMGVFLRRFDASGLPIGSDFQVNTFTTGAQRRPRMAADADGDFVVVWQGEGSQDGFGAGIFMKAFDSAGFPATGDLQVNAYTSGAQESPAVGLAPDGRFVIAWQGPNLLVPSTREIWVRRFDASALPLAVETLANTTVGQTLGYPAVGVGSDGFVVAWQAADEAGVPLGGIAARRFALSNGAALGSEFLVNAFTTGTQDQAAVAAHPTGGFLLTWSSVGQDGSGRGVFAREFGPDGAAFDEFRVSSFTIADQAQPALAPHDGGRFLVVWRSDGQDGSLGGIFARKVAAERIFGNGFQ